MYLYRAVDSAANTLESLLSETPIPKLPNGPWPGRLVRATPPLFE
jgi:hypothetical protein